MSKLLSVLIPTLVERRVKFNFIYNRLNVLLEKNSFNDLVEIIVLEDNREKSTGEKRNILKENCIGKYICYIDDDDDISDDYFTLIIDAINKSDADVITFKLHQQTDEKNDGVIRFNKYLGQGNLGDIRLMPPTHLCPHKKILADKIKFPHINFMEDTEYMNLLDKLTVTEQYIDEILYFYKYVSGKY